MVRTLFSRLWGTLHRRRLDEEFDEEVQAHLQMLAGRFIAQGMEPAEAFYAARRQFGGVTQVKEDLRERRGLPPFDVLVQDARHAFRQLRNAKGFTVSAALTLAVGIGASTAVFAVFDAVMLRPLPFSEPERFMAVHSMDRRGKPHPTSFSYPNFFDFRRQNRVFQNLVCYRDAAFTLTDSQPAIQVPGEIVSWDLFPLLGLRPALGRGFLPQDEKPGSHVAVISDALWKRRFGGDPGILGRRVRINGRPFAVVGVAPSGFHFPVDNPAAEVWATISEDATAAEFHPLTDQRGARVLRVMGRLMPGVSAEQAQAQMDAVAGALARQYPDANKNVATTWVQPELERLVGTSRKPLWGLLGAVLLVLLIACANVASLLLARSTERAREFALRMALGASRPALVRQMLVESVTLGSLGTAGGLLLALGALKAFLPLAGDSIPRIADAGVDSRVLAFSALLTMLTSMFFSVAPAVQAAGADPAGRLKQGARSIAGGHGRFRSALVIGQVTVGLVLLVGAEMLMAGFLRLVQRDPGFRADHLLTFDISVPESEYNVSRQIAFSDLLLQKLKAIPGVQAAATGVPLPLAGNQMSVAFDIEERPAAPPDRPSSDMAIITPGYFGAMGIPLLQGRDFSERDDSRSPLVLVVNEAFARKYFPGEEVIGKRIRPGAHGGEGPTMREIVGVVGNAKQVPLSTEPDPIYYFPYKQLSWGIGTVVLRTAVPPQTVRSAAQAAVASLDPQVPVYGVRTGTELSAMSLAPMKTFAMLMGSFAAVALMLTGAGLYGVLSYAVARRRAEIGVRIALGAGRTEVLGLVFRQAMQLVAAGIVLGVAIAAMGERLLGNTIFGLRPGDPAILLGACCVLVAVGMAAAYVPALRAASVNPMQALRSE